jgi:hypothetical protein
LFNHQTKSKYASYADLDRAVRPIYSDHGFSLSFDSGDNAPADCVRVVCKVAHRGGHREIHHLDMPADGKGAKGGDVMTKTHATGAAITYGKRYLLGMIFNLAVGEDDDGNSAGGKARREGDAPKSSWGAGGKQGAVDEADRDGLLDPTRQKGKPPANPKPAPETDRLATAKRNAKELTTDQVVKLNEGEPSIAELRKLEEVNAVRIEWMQGELPEQHDRFYGAFNNALQRAIARGDREEETK